LPPPAFQNAACIVAADGIGKTFAMEDNKNWFGVTRPILEAFFHARYFLDMAVEYGRELEYPRERCRAVGRRCSIYIT
jgi:hypothetical protein